MHGKADHNTVWKVAVALILSSFSVDANANEAGVGGMATKATKLRQNGTKSNSCRNPNII